MIEVKRFWKNTETTYVRTACARDPFSFKNYISKKVSIYDSENFAFEKSYTYI